ncbi:MAG: cation diffusion facilitator family transporter [Muribaculaceae bacterium]|nr:cation diffusion facilitator family transporter [Muribaculaceae bacterium]
MHQNKSIPTLADSLTDNRQTSARLIRRAVKIGCAVNIILMCVKLSVGYYGHSDALFADGFHSLNDIAADLIMLAFVGFSYKTPDSRYSYGYGKFQTFASFLISTLLIIIGCGIITEAVEAGVKYFEGAILPQPDIWTIVAVLFAIACKESLYRFYSKMGHKADAPALSASAWHHRSDGLASIATLIGVTCAHFLGIGWRILDPIASIVIAGIILINAIMMWKRSFFELMEKSLPADQINQALTVVGNVPGVEGIEFLRTRRNGHSRIFDVGIAISPTTDLATADKIRTDVIAALEDEFCRHIMVTVTVLPSSKK